LLKIYSVGCFLNLSISNVNIILPLIETRQKLLVMNKKSADITLKDVLDIQKKWGEGIIRIGKVYVENGNYRKEAEDFIDSLYGYDLGEVLFKPTLASEKQFRTTKEGALSYFVGNNSGFPEDVGFALKPWQNVRWENRGIKTIGNMAIAMGNYYFLPANGNMEIKVEFTFAYTKDENGNLRIIMHGSHVPYGSTRNSLKP